MPPQKLWPGAGVTSIGPGLSTTPSYLNSPALPLPRPLSLFELGLTIAAELRESAEATYLTCVIPQPQPLSHPQPTPYLSLKPKAVKLSSLLDDLSQHWPAADTSSVAVLPDEAVSLVNYSPVSSNYNRVGEQLVGRVGFDDLFFDFALTNNLIGGEQPLPPPTHIPRVSEAAVTLLSASEVIGRGPVVIIPPQDPVLALFVGHALTHILQDGYFWSSLYVLTSQNPLVLQEWD